MKFGSRAFPSRRLCCVQQNTFLFLLYSFYVIIIFVSFCFSCKQVHRCSRLFVRGNINKKAFQWYAYRLHHHKLNVSKAGRVYPTPWMPYPLKKDMGLKIPSTPPQNTLPLGYLTPPTHTHTTPPRYPTSLF